MKRIAVIIALLNIISITSYAVSALDLLRRDFRSAKQTFQHPVELFHYFNLYDPASPQTQTLLTSAQGRAYLVKKRIQFATETFWSEKSKNQGLFAGNGLYLAIDPLISEEYGNLMIQFKLKPQATYISLKKGVLIKGDTVRALYSEGILKKYPDDIIPESMKFTERNLNSMLSTDNKKFRAVILQVLKAERITLFEYNWRSSLELICNDNSSKSAFIYIGSDETMPEFSDTTLVDIKSLLTLKSISPHEAQVKSETNKLVELLKLNDVATDLNTQIINATTTYGSFKKLHQRQESLFGCEPY